MWKYDIVADTNDRVGYLDQRVYLFYSLMSKCSFIDQRRSIEMGTVFAFSAPSLIPADTMQFCTSYAVSSEVNRCHPKLSKQLALSNSLGLSRLSSVIHFQDDGSGNYIIKKSIWHQPSVCPWGQSLPIQCPGCKTIRSLQLQHSGKTLDVKKQHISGSVVYKCHCGYTLVKKFGDQEMSGAIWDIQAKGAWIEVDLLPDAETKSSKM